MLAELLASILALLLFREFYWKRRGLPPGPLPIPLIGNMLSIACNYPGTSLYQQWKNAYGSIYTYWMGYWPIVTVNDYETMHQMFVSNGDNYIDRASLGNITTEYRGGEYGIIEANGNTWREQRRFALHTLRDFGMGKAAMEHRLMVELEWILNTMERESSEKGSTSPMKYMDRTVESGINDMIFGYRFDDEHFEDFNKIRKMMEDQQKAQSNPALIAAFFSNTLRTYIPYLRRQYEHAMGLREELFGFFQKKIDQHRATIDYDSEESSDFCEAYLKEIRKREKDPESTFNDKQLVNVVLDLCMAGLESTSATMSWGMCLILNYPQVQSTMHDELARVLGNESTVALKDRPSLPYCQAVINEVQRWANVVPQNLLRKTSKDDFANGVHIKAGTFVAPQISMLLHDPKEFPSPETFDPTRFLDDEGKLVHRTHFLPFSVGRRQCPGEGLAKTELFLFFTNLIHRYQISPVDAAKSPSLQRKMTSGVKPLEFECVVNKRHPRST